MKTKTKILNYIAGASLIGLIFGLLFASCEDDANKVSALTLSAEEITIGSEGGVELITVTSADKWVALSTEPWVMISPANGVGTTECSIAIDSTLINDMRTATIRFSADGQEKSVIIRQTGFDKMIVLEDAEIEIEASDVISKRNFKALVTTNIDFKIEIEYKGDSKNWLTPSEYSVELDRGARPRTANINFDWRMNPITENRVAGIKFIPKNKEDELESPVVLKVTQKAAPIIEDTRAGDSLAILTIAEKLQMSIQWNVII